VVLNRKVPAVHQKPPGHMGFSASWRGLTDPSACTRSQLVLAGERNLAQASENTKAAELKLEPADLQRIRPDVIALGEPANA
jgi:hypothetical protein